MTGVLLLDLVLVNLQLSHDLYPTTSWFANRRICLGSSRRSESVKSTSETTIFSVPRQVVKTYSCVATGPLGISITRFSATTQVWSERSGRIVCTPVNLPIAGKTRRFCVNQKQGSRT